MSIVQVPACIVPSQSEQVKAKPPLPHSRSWGRHPMHRVTVVGFTILLHSNDLLCAELSCARLREAFCGLKGLKADI